MPAPKNPLNALTATELAHALGETYEDSLLVFEDDAENARSLFQRGPTEWPKSGSTSKLSTFATNRPRYMALLGYIANGTRVSTAARALGLLYREISTWMHTGAHDANSGKDTVYSWFYLDCYRARGSSLVKAEIAAYQNDPESFIGRVDRGGQFNPEEQFGLETVFREDEAAAIVEQQSQESDDGDITSTDVHDMFKALAGKGVTDLNKFVDAAATQASQSDPNNPKTPETPKTPEPLTLEQPDAPVDPRPTQGDGPNSDH